MSSCNDIQEKIARDESLSGAERAHTIACESCAAVIADFTLLEAALRTFGTAVPAGFVDRVMAGLPAEGTATPSAPRRWVPLTVAYAAAVLAVLNVGGFLANVFTASVALGGTP